MKRWWQQLSTREKLILTSGSVFLALILFYFFIWSPVTRSLTNMKQTVVYQQRLLQWMKPAVIELQRLRQTGKTLTRTSSENLLAVTDQSLEKAKLNQYATRIAQSGTANVLIRFKQVPFDDLMAWLIKLWQNHGIKVIQLTATPHKKISGVVDVEMLLGTQA